MKLLIKDFGKRILGVVSGLFTFYLPLYLLIIVDGTWRSLTLSNFVRGSIKALYPEPLITFAIPINILLAIWLCLGIGYFISSGKLHKFLYYLYLAYSLLFQLVAMAYALGTWTMPGDHREGSPYPSIIGCVIVYCLIAMLIWFMLPKKFKE